MIIAVIVWLLSVFGFIGEFAKIPIGIGIKEGKMKRIIMLGIVFVNNACISWRMFLGI